MSLAEVLPAVQALTREEKAELVRIVTEHSKHEWIRPQASGFYANSLGLHDERSSQGAAVLLKAIEVRRWQP
jgi:hypothetical protein